MEIDDILKKERFKELDSFLTEEMHRYAGDDLVKKMKDALGAGNSARSWFYSPLISLGGKRPYDYCKNGNLSEIEDLLGRIEHGVYS